METEITLDALLTRFPRLALAVDPADLRWRPSVRARGLIRLPVLCGARSGRADSLPAWVS
ncbi:cytochrome P450 [Streptacidiphilus sp. MAP12-33]|uniref:hypothetical protein n=1 Tax=Streptacidiphilus sp. MAP12-33 TaxID=3156266 RepID=UPI003516EA88